MKTIVYETQSVIDALKHGIWDICFIKKDMSTRQMRGTLDPLYLEESTNTSKKTTPNIDGLIRVYDVENEGWRSFFVSSLTSFSQTHECI